MSSLQEYMDDSPETLPVPADQPQMGTLVEQVETLILNHKQVLEHDDLLCIYYHLAYGDWSVESETPNHWVIHVPADRSQERSDASIVRARREVMQDKSYSQSIQWLETRNNPAWSEDEWLEWLRERQEQALQADGAEILDIPEVSFEDQILYVLLNHPETREDDKALIQTWRLLWGGWQGGDGTYSVPRDWRWRTTTPESITACRRRWQQAGVATAGAETQAVREEREETIRQAYREGRSPWEEDL